MVDGSQWEENVSCKERGIKSTNQTGQSLLGPQIDAQRSQYLWELDSAPCKRSLKGLPWQRDAKWLLGTSEYTEKLEEKIRKESQRKEKDGKGWIVKATTISQKLGHCAWRQLVFMSSLFEAGYKMHPRGWYLTKDSSLEQYLSLCAAAKQNIFTQTNKVFSSCAKQSSCLLPVTTAAFFNSVPSSRIPATFSQYVAWSRNLVPDL